jgi:succinate-acetate transporter protein
VPLQLLASVFGFLSRDPVAATGMGILSGTWAVAGITTLTNPPGTASEGLGVLLLVAGLAMFVPAAAAMDSKIVPAAVMGLAGTRFVVTGAYELTGSAEWKSAAGWLGIALAVLALYAALALELEGVRERGVLPIGRRGSGRAAMAGEGPLEAAHLIKEAGVRPQL